MHQSLIASETLPIFPHQCIYKAVGPCCEDCSRRIVPYKCSHASRYSGFLHQSCSRPFSRKDCQSVQPCLPARVGVGRRDTPWCSIRGRRLFALLSKYSKRHARPFRVVQESSISLNYGILCCASTRGQGKRFHTKLSESMRKTT